MTSACDILLEEPERFVDYLIADAKVRSKITDEESFGNALNQVLRADPTLQNIAQTIKKAGETFEVCGVKIMEQPQIKRLISSNVASRKESIRSKLKKDKPKLKGKAFNSELDRRLKISLGRSRKAKVKQVSLKESLQPVRVEGYKRAGKTVSAHRKTKSRMLSKQERMLIENALRRGKKPSQVIKDYYDAGLTFRSETSIRRHYYRIKG